MLHLHMSENFALADHRKPCKYHKNHQFARQLDSGFAYGIQVARQEYVPDLRAQQPICKQIMRSKHQTSFDNVFVHPGRWFRYFPACKNLWLREESYLSLRTNTDLLPGC